MTSFIPVNKPLFQGNEAKYLAECINSGWISSEGPFVQQFEEMMAHRVGRRFGIAVCNGSAALDIAAAALMFQPGDEVIVPTFTIISCIAAIIRSGAVPVLVDADPLTWNMDLDQASAAITPKTRAIMVVHIYGLPVDMKRVSDLATKHNLRVIEDAAEAIGQTCWGKPCGSFGDISTFSFYPNKHVTTGEGGMIMTDDPGLAERCRSLRNLCFQQKRFVHEELGWNYRMSNLQAALGLAQLENLDKVTIAKRAMGERYNSALNKCVCVQVPLPRTDYADNIYWVYGVVINTSDDRDAEEVMTKLLKVGIGTRPFFYPMHQQPVFKKRGMFVNDHFPTSERISRKGFYLPSGVSLTPGEIDRVADAILEICGER